MQCGPLKSIYWIFCLFAVTESSHAKCICGHSELMAQYAVPLFFTGPIDIPSPRTICSPHESDIFNCKYSHQIRIEAN